MSLFVETSWLDTFSTSFVHLAQQKKSLLRSTVDEEPTKGENAHFDQIGQVDPVKRTSRHADTPQTDVPHDRRVLSADDWEMAEIIDSQDKLRTLKDPQSAYAQAFAAGFGRRMDLTILEAAFAPARTGKTGGTTVNFPSTQQVAVDYVESGGAVNSSLTLGKIRKVLELFEFAEVDESDPLTAVISEREKNYLLRTAEFTSQDYNDERKLISGARTKFYFMGINWIVMSSRRLQLNGAGHRRIPIYAKSGIKFGMHADVETNAAKDPTKGFNMRLHSKASFGATRMEEVKVVEMICTAT